MQLNENQLFDGRYRLVQLIGRGASAEVWKAIDTKAGNMPVAVKIYKPDTLGPGSKGIAEFQREFTMVYNMTHTNLLHPQGFDICEGSPYLVMAYCENGSANSMVGRFSEDDLLQFLRDVAAGLEYLHDHNITHQDIKPDNILVDDNCNYMVTDFGISRRESANDAIGGTRAYMAPEVYKRQPQHASDIWSLGATAVELVTGQPPYGELGGAAQMQSDAPVQINAKLSKPVKKLITGMLDPDPRKRPSAAAIRTSIDHFRETGSWDRNSQRNKIAYIVAGVLSVIVCLGLFVWDRTRTKVQYFDKVVEIWGVPHGINRISELDQKHRAITYKLEYRGGKLRRMSVVNAKGKITNFNDTEQATDALQSEYFYTNDGKIDYLKIYDRGGECMHIVDYDANLVTASFKADDGYSTEKPLPGKTTETSNYNGETGLNPNTSSITRYRITYDDLGRRKKVEYATSQNVDVVDEDMIHGKEFEYDADGRVTKMTFIGLDGNPRGNKRGLAVKKYGYDENGFWNEIRYETVDGSASSDGSNIAMVRISHDQYGNRTAERYLTSEGEPMLRSDMNVAGFDYELNDEGLPVMMTAVGLDEKPAFTKIGFSKQRTVYNEDGFEIRNEFLDDKDSLVNVVVDGSTYSIMTNTVNDRGLVTSVEYFDRFNNPSEDSYGASSYKLELDSVGRILSVARYNKDGKPALLKGFYYKNTTKYDKMGNEIENCYYNEKDELTPDEQGVACYIIDHDRSGKMTKLQFLGPDRKPVLCKNRFSIKEFKYDERGNLVSEQLFNTDGKPIECADFWQSSKSVYDPATNFQTGYYQYSIGGNQISGVEQKYDARGNVTERRVYKGAGQLAPGTAVEHSAYDTNNRVVKIWYTDASGKRTNDPDDGKYCESRYVYDTFGNVVETTFWDVNGNAGASATKVHKMVREYNKLQQMVVWKNFGVDGKPIADSAENTAEAHYAYDERGNEIELTLYDGYGKPINTSNGWFRRTQKFDARNHLIEYAYFNKEGKPVVNKADEVARKVITYDNHDNIIKIEDYGVDKLIMVTTRKYNSHDQQTEESYKDANGKTPAGYNSRVTIEYEADEITPKKLSAYGADGKLVGWMIWNATKNEWGDPQFAAGQSTVIAPPNTGGGGSGTSIVSDWKDEFRELAAQCPMKINDDLDLYSISVGSNSVTMTYRLNNISKYEMSESDKSTYRDLIRELESSLSSELPNGASLYIRLVDRADRAINL